MLTPYSARGNSRIPLSRARRSELAKKTNVKHDRRTCYTAYNVLHPLLRRP
jgi:hypothetical protein